MMHRAKVLEDIVRILPPEVAARVNSVVDSQLEQHARLEQVLASESAAHRASSSTSSGASGAAAASDAEAAAAAAAAELEKPPLPGFSSELESWVALAHMLASEVASVESQLQETKLRPEKAVSLLRQVKEKLTSSAILPESARSDSGSGMGSGSNSRARSARSSPSLPPRPSEPCFTTESSREASLPASNASTSPAAPGSFRTFPPERVPPPSSAQWASGGRQLLEGDRHLPHARAEGRHSPPPRPFLECSQIRLLIVEDDEFQRRALRQQSIRVGFAAVHTAATGEEALQLLSDGLAVDLCLIDINLGPGITGVEVLQSIQQLEQLDELATVMLSADDSPAVIEQCLVENADSFVLKPLSSKELGTLSVFVARRRQRMRDNAHRMADLKQCIHEVENSLQVLQETPRPPPPSPADLFYSSPGRGLLHHLRDYVDGPHSRLSKGLITPSVRGAIEGAAALLLGASTPTRDDTPGNDRDGVGGTGPLQELAHPKTLTRRDKGGGGSAADKSGGGGEGGGGPGACGLGKRSSSSVRVEAGGQRACSTCATWSDRAGDAKLTRAEGEGANSGQGEGRADGANSGQGAMSGGGAGVGGVPCSPPAALCRLCERLFPESEFAEHLVSCAQRCELHQVEQATDREVATLLAELDEARADAMQSLLLLTMQRHALLCEPLHHLSALGRALLQQRRSGAPHDQMGRLTLLARDLIALAKKEGSTGLGGQVFSSKASQLRAIISEKVGRLQQSIALLPKNCLEQSPDRSTCDAPVTRAPTLRDFSLLRCLGTGGYAEVWLASKRSTGDVFAIKALKRTARLAVGGEVRSASQQKSSLGLPVKIEDTILQKHQSPHLIHGYFSFATATHDFLVLEYMPGGDLSTMLLRLGFVAEPMASFYVLEVLLGLRYLHEQGVLHHDIKPSNVLVAGSGHIKLADFGLSSSMKLQGGGKGTLPYLAPEVLQEGTKGTEAVDMWAVGVLIYELLSGEHPFQGTSSAEMLASILQTAAMAGYGWNAEALMCSEAALALCRSLLSVQVDARPDCEVLVQGHPFFDGLPPWDQIHEHPPPFVPQLKSVDDTKYFEEEHFTRQMPEEQGATSGATMSIDHLVFLSQQSLPSKVTIESRPSWFAPRPKLHTRGSSSPSSPALRRRDSTSPSSARASPSPLRSRNSPTPGT